MKIDISTILLIVLCTIPGVIAQHSANLVRLSRKTEKPKGAATELAELVGLGFSTHGILILIAAFLLLIAGLRLHRDYLYFFHFFNTLDMERLWVVHRSKMVLGSLSYLALSFCFSHWCGLIYGVLAPRMIVTRAVVGAVPGLASYLVRQDISLGGEQIDLWYYYLSPSRDQNGTETLVFVEIEMKNAMGIYSGQVHRLAYFSDDQENKPIVLIDVSFRPNGTSEYQPLTADGTAILDLSDAIRVSVRHEWPLADSEG